MCLGEETKEETTAGQLGIKEEKEGEEFVVVKPRVHPQSSVLSPFGLSRLS